MDPPQTMRTGEEPLKRERETTLTIIIARLLSSLIKCPVAMSNSCSMASFGDENYLVHGSMIYGDA